MFRLKPANVIRRGPQQATRLLNRLAASRRMRTWLLGGILIFGAVPYALLLLVSQVWMPYGLRGQYYANVNWTDAPLLITRDRVPSLQRVSRLEPALSDDYSIEWIGVLVVPTSGTYRFALTSDDGSWLSLNGQMVVDNGGYHGERTQSNTITLPKGVQPISIRYMQGSGDAILRVFWQPPGQAQTLLPAPRLFVEPPGKWLRLLDQTVAFAWFVFTMGWLVILVMAGVVTVSCPRAALAVLKVSLLGKIWSHSMIWLFRRDPDEAVFTWRSANAWPLSRWGYLVLVMSFLLNVWGISWGIPGGRGWVTDELTPDLVQSALENGFAHTWAIKYPPFHYYLLVLIRAPFMLLHRLGWLDIQSEPVYFTLFYAGRFLSVLMATGIVWLTYLCGCVVDHKGSALFAALLTALMPTFLYYAKNVNLDVPYTFWFMASFYFYLRSRRAPYLPNYLLFFMTATLAVCTKDQAYALYILPSILLFGTHYRYQRRQHPTASPVHIVFHRNLVLPLLTAILLFALIHNLPFNSQGFRSHLAYITGTGSQAYQLYANTLAGHAQMFWQALKHLQFALGWPAFLVCIAGLVGACVQRSPRGWMMWLLLPPLSSYLFFISLIRYHYVRFFMPICIVLALFGGKFLWDFLHLSKRWRLIRYVVVGFVLGYTFFYAAAVDIWMAFDARYYVERWLRKNVATTSSVGFIGFREYLPRMTHLPNATSITDAYFETVKATAPHYLVINSDLSRRYPEFYVRLDQRTLGYTRVLRYQTRFPWLPLQPALFIKNGQRVVFTELEKVNPEIQVFKRER